METSAVKKAANRKYYAEKIKPDDERYERFRKQALASYHKNKDSWKERERRDRYNARRRKGPARGNYGARCLNPKAGGVPSHTSQGSAARAEGAGYHDPSTQAQHRPGGRAVRRGVQFVHQVAGGDALYAQ